MKNATCSQAVPAGTPVHGYSALFCRLPVGQILLLPLQDRYTISQAMRQEHQCGHMRLLARGDLKTNTLRLRRVA